MNAIVAVDASWGIGFNNKLLVSIKEDLRNFARLTKGKTVIYGSRTLATFPGAEPLKGRTNIILTRKTGLSFANALVAHSVEEALELVSGVPSDDVFVIGGESVYRQCLPYCDCCYVTKINRDFEKDVYFPDLDASGDWALCYRSAAKYSSPETDGIGGLEYFFAKYRRND